MAPDLFPAGTQLQLGLHHRDEQSPKRLTRRALMRGTIAATAVGMVPFGSARAQTDPPPKRPPITIETKLKDGVYQWNGRVSNRVPNAGPKATSFLSAAFNSPAARAFQGARPVLRVLGRAAGIIGVASMVWDVANWGLGIISRVTAYDPEKWRTADVATQPNGEHPAYKPVDMKDFYRPPPGYPFTPTEAVPNPVKYNEPLTFDFVSGPLIAFAQLTAEIRLPSTSIFTVRTQNTGYNAVRPAPTLTQEQKVGLSESLTFHNQWTYTGGDVQTGLTVVVTQYRVVNEVPAPTWDWDSVENVLKSFPQGLAFTGAGIAETLNEMFRNSGDTDLFNAVAQTPFVASDFPNITIADVLTETPDLVEIDQDQPDIEPNPGTGTPTVIDWGIFTPPGFELPALEVPEVPTAQEIIDTLTNPLSALIPVPSGQPVACPPFPWLMGQQVTAHCPAVELAQPWMGNASKIAAQIAAFFIALRE